MTATGLLEISAEAYHADVDGPSLSASIAHTLFSRSPAHARIEHPRLNPDFQREEKRHFDVGTVVHSLLLEDRSDVHIIHADNYRKKDVQAERDAAREAGFVPLLEREYDEVIAMVAAVREKLTAHEAEPTPLTNGSPERTLFWEEPGGVKCRARLDWLHDDLRFLDDVKSAANANPEAWTRRAIYDHGYDVRCAFHLRGVKQALGAEPQWRWIVIEKTPPFEVIVVEPGQDVLALAEAKVVKAIERWRRCLETDTWPGYETRVITAELPPWEETRFLEREAQAA